MISRFAGCKALTVGFGIGGLTWRSTTTVGMAHKHHVSVKAAVKVAQSKVNKLSKVKPTAP
jgi:hypothetical protein